MKFTKSFVVVLCVLQIVGVSFAQEQITFVIDGDWMPRYNKAKAEPRGYFCEIVEAIYGKENIIYLVQPWERSIFTVENGKADGLLAASPGDGDFILPTQEIGMLDFGFLMKKNRTLKGQKLDAFKDLTVIVIDGYVIDSGGPIDRYISAKDNKGIYKLHGMLSQGIEMVRLGRYDAFLEDSIFFKYVIHRDKLKGVEVHPIGVQIALYIGFTNSIRGKTLAAQFDEGFRKLEENGQFQKILAKYGIEDWNK